MDEEPIWARVWAFIWKLGSGSRSASGWKVGSGSASNKKYGSGSISNKNLNPDPHLGDKSNADPQHWFELPAWIFHRCRPGSPRLWPRCSPRRRWRDCSSGLCPLLAPTWTWCPLLYKSYTVTYLIFPLFDHKMELAVAKNQRKRGTAVSRL
jgi:hypothetical protein